MTLELIEDFNGSELNSKFIGILDKLSAPNLEKRLEEIPEHINKIVIDFTQVEYISSAGLRLLAKVQALMDSREGTFILKNPNSSVMSVFKMTGFDSILTIE